MTDLYQQLGVFKCLGCKHYLSGDGFDCEKNCPRTEDGTEQVVYALQNNEREMRKLEREQLELLKKRSKLWNLLYKREAKRKDEWKVNPNIMMPDYRKEYEKKQAKKGLT